jgi:3-methyladenine DNA glycosylase AlkD
VGAFQLGGCGMIEDVSLMLMENRETEYADFMANLLPNLPKERILGVRTPILRKMAKQMIREDTDKDFIKQCPHEFFEENQLHGFIISERKDFAQCMAELEHFLPYMDNWATCDQTSPKIFKKNKEKLMPYIEIWLQSERTYTVRFAIGMLMKHFLEDDFLPEYLDMVAGIQSEEYYINMEIAWYMATALAKQWESTISYIENKKMGVWVHNKTIQKAVESYRITEEQKCYLKTFRIHGTR